MKILMIAPQPFFEPRGTPISVLQRLQALSALGYEVDLATYHVGQDIALPGLQIHRIAKIPFIKEVKLGPSWWKPLLDLFLFLKCLRLLLFSKYDAIHSHEEASFFSILLSAVFRTPHIYDMHSSLPRQLENFKFGNWWPLIQIFEFLEKITIRTCDVVITIGTDLAELVYKINPDVKHLTIENRPLKLDKESLDLNAQMELKKEMDLLDRLPIVYTGTFETYQGLDLLLDSAELVIQQNPKASFILVGGKPDQIVDLHRSIQAKKLSDHVKIVGTVSPERALLFTSIAEILVSPRVEGTSIPMKIYSYLYSGKPTVATELGAHTQILNEEIACLVKPTKEALAEGILDLLHNPQRREFIGQNARNFAKSKYGFEEYLAKIEQAYQIPTPPKKRIVVNGQRVENSQ